MNPMQVYLNCRHALLVGFGLFSTMQVDFEEFATHLQWIVEQKTGLSTIDRSKDSNL